MAADTTTYALGIELALNSQPAFESLDKFGKSMESLEQQVSSSAAKALTNISNALTVMETSLTTSNTLIGGISTTSSEVIKSFQGAVGEVNDIGDGLANVIQLLEEKKDLIDEELKVYDKIALKETDELKTIQKTKTWWGYITKAIKEKNVLHGVESDLVRDENALLEKASAIVEGRVAKEKTSQKSLSEALTAIKGMVNALLAVDKAAESFVATNYRAYGSQVALANSSRALAADLGMTEENAVATYKALADVATPKDSLDKIAKTVGMASRSTGVSTAALADYTKKLRAAGLGAEGTEKNIGMLTEAMRKGKLNTQDITNTMATNSATMYDLQMMLGGTPETVEGVTGAFLSLKSAATELGVGTEAIDDLQKKLSSPEEMLKFGNIMQVNVKSADDLKRALLKAGKQLATMEQNAKGSAQGAIQYNARLESMGFGKESARAAIEMYKKTSQELGRSAETAADLNEVYDQSTGSVKGQFAATKTLTQELAILSARFAAVYAVVVSFVSEGLKDLLSYLNWIFDWIGPMISIISKWGTAFYNCHGAVKVTIGIIRGLVTALVLVGGALMGLGIALGVAGAALGTFSLSGGVMVTMAGTIATAITTVTGAIITAMVSFLTGLGTGLATLGASITPVIIPLMQLSGAFLVTAIAIFIIVEAFSRFCAIADLTWEKGLMFVLIIGIIGLVLVGLSMLIQGPILVGLLALSAAFVSIGIAAAGVGALISAVGYVINAFATVLQVITTIDPEKAESGMAALGKGLNKLIYEAGGFVGGAQLLAIGGGIAAVGLAAIPLSSYGPGAAEAAKKLAVEIPALAAVADKIAGAGNKFAEEMRAFGEAATAALPLDQAGTYMQSAADKFTYAATAFKQFSEMTSGLETASYELINAAGVLQVAGEALIPGVEALGTVSMPLLWASWGLSAAANSLGPAATYLSSSLDALSDSAKLFLGFGDNMKAGAESLSKSGELMKTASAALTEGSNALKVVSAILAPVLYSLIGPSMAASFVGYYLESGASAINRGAILLRDGGLILSEGVNYISSAATNLLDAAVNLQNGIILLKVTADELMTAAVSFKTGATLLEEGAMLLGIAIAELFFVSSAIMMTAVSLSYGLSFLYYTAEYAVSIGKSIASAGAQMLTGSLGIAAALMILGSAGPRMTTIATAINTGAADLTAALKKLEQAGSVLLEASRHYYPASLSIFFAMGWLQLAVGRYTGSVEKMKIISDSMLNLATAFVMISKAPLKAFKESAEEALAAMPSIDKLADGMTNVGNKISIAAPKMVEPVKSISASLKELEIALCSIVNSGAVAATPLIGAVGVTVESTANALDRSAAKMTAAITQLQASMTQIETWSKNFGSVSVIFEEATKKFIPPADALAATMDRLGASIAAFGEGMDITDKIMNLAGTMTTSAELFESAAERIQVAINAKAIPAMRSAEQAGIKEAVKSQAVATVKVMKDEGGSTFALSDEKDIAYKTLEELIKLNLAVSVIGDANASGPVGEIVSLLQTYLPSMNKESGGLTSNMNGWNK